ncbi:MAG: plastocyanin/azurin family copper-binding protein [Nitrososphaeraceae archaeon]
MSNKRTIAILSIFFAVLALAATLASLVPITSLSAQQNPTTAQTDDGSRNTASGGTKISIVPGASTLVDKAFSPNPANVKVGDNVTWTNDDTMFHTVTSGTGTSDTNKGKEFDSGLSGPTTLTTTGKTFDHKFTTAGEFPYFCQLHPTMAGKVVVS